jgi:2-keto-4-pentenoate hydratase/2-oxohepta-3-ene-1,7-dioic acid hydratase in catechol pathway
MSRQPARLRGLSDRDRRPLPPRAAERAHEVIAGCTITNDRSVRDRQVRGPTMTMGKSFDTHRPLGPWLVTAEELGDPHDLALQTYVNHELHQDGSTGEMISTASSRSRIRLRRSRSSPAT